MSFRCLPILGEYRIKELTMKLVHLTVAILIAALFSAAPQRVCGQETKTSDAVTCSPCGKTKCESCPQGKPCNSHPDSTVGRYGEGKIPGEPGGKIMDEPGWVHGHGHYPEQVGSFGYGIRQAFGPADRPYFGMHPITYPLMAQRQGGGVYPPSEPRFPRLHSFFVQPVYMTTAPQPPMPTYTTRGPRDFLNPNPPSIGY